MAKRKRFKTAAIASSYKYTESKENNRRNLINNHEANKEYFSSLANTVVVKSELQLFEEGVKRQLAAFKQSIKS